MKLLNFDKVLCISPHPDDSEAGFLGTILKNYETKFDIICLSKGGAKKYDKTNKLDRVSEINKIWNELNCKNVTFNKAKYKYIQDADESNWINYIEKTFFKKNKYDCVLIPTNEDSNFEHRFISNFGLALCRFSPVCVIEYQTLSTLNSWTPNFFVDIKDKYLIKLKSLSYIKSQKDKPYFTKESLLSFHTNFQCSKKGLNKVEKFKILELFK